MNWHILVVLRILIGGILGQILLKQLSSAPSRTRNIVWQYLFTGALAFIAAAVTQSFVFSWQVAIVAGFGVLSAFAGYCHWRAVDISLSKSALFGPGGDVWAMFLGFVFLHESKHLNPLLWVGLVLALGAVILFFVSKAKQARQDDKIRVVNKKERWIWIGLAIGVMIWGTSAFLTRYLVVEIMSPWTFMMAWYGGSVIGSFAVFALAGKKEAGEPLGRRQILWIFPRSAVMWISFVLSGWTLKYAPITVVQPIFVVSGIVLSTILGLWVFKEVKQLSTLEKIATAIGVIGGVVIALSFRQN